MSGSGWDFGEQQVWFAPRSSVSAAGLAGGWGAVEARASWSRTGGVCSEARRGTPEVPLVTVHLGPGMMGREVGLASCLSL